VLDKPLEWLGASRKDVRAFPRAARRRCVTWRWPGNGSAPWLVSAVQEA